MNEVFESTSPFEWTYSSSSSRSCPSAFASALTFASKRASSAAFKAATRVSSFAKDAPHVIVMAANRTTGNVMRRRFINWLVHAGRGCYDATRSPIDQTLSERPSSMRAPKAQVSARKRSGKRTAGFEGGLWRAMAPSECEGMPPTEGVRFAAQARSGGPDLSGSRTEGRREEYGDWPQVP